MKASLHTLLCFAALIVANSLYPQTRGLITQYLWNDIDGNVLDRLLQDERYPDAPDATSTLNTFTIGDLGDSYGMRIAGYLHVDVSGTYQFAISADDDARLHLSDSFLFADLEEIARVEGAVAFNSIDSRDGQISDSIYLEAGKYYAIEALLKEGVGFAFVTVFWKYENSAWVIIPGNNLSPIEPIKPLLEPVDLVIQSGDAVTVPLSPNALDPNGIENLSNWSLRVDEAPANGSTTILDSIQSVNYEHDGVSPVNDSFQVSVQDDDGLWSDPVTITITVQDDGWVPAGTLQMPGSLPGNSYDATILPDITLVGGPLDLDYVASDPDALYVSDKTGRVWRVNHWNTNPEITLALDVSAKLDTRAEAGVAGFAFHPDFAQNGYVFIYFNEWDEGNSNAYSTLSRFTIPQGQYIADTSSRLDFIRQLDEQSNHQGGGMAFGPDDGYLYLGLGDEGGSFDVYGNSQRIDKDFFSAVIRIDVDKKPGSLAPNEHPSVVLDELDEAHYAIPPDNPYIGATSFNGISVDSGQVRTEFWAVGLRNPWKLSFDAATGKLYCSDVGEFRREEVNLIEKGKNYGWAYYEGTEINDSNIPDGFEHAESLYEYNHGNGFAVTGGFVYRGSIFPELYGHYLFADYITGTIFALDLEDPSRADILVRSSLISGLYPSPDGEEVLLSAFTGHLLKLTSAVEGDANSIPQKLSDTGAFESLETLAPNPGVIAYDVNVPFWSDHAIKQRWFALTDSESNFNYADDASWGFDEGAVWIKHFDMEMERGNAESRRRIETRFIVAGEDGEDVYGVSYQWNDEQTEAYLAPSSGIDFDLEVNDGGEIITQRWRIPSLSQCMVCHNDQSGSVLSFNTRQLNCPSPLNPQENQIEMLGNLGYFDEPAPAVHTLPSFAAADDATQSLEHRARSFFAVNCVQCHQPGGSAPTNWDARASTLLADMGLINVAPGTSLSDGKQLITPGDSDLSAILDHIAGNNGYQRMPPLASNVFDEAAITMLRDWIDNELSFQNFATWQLTHFDSTTSPEALADADADADGNSNYLEYLTHTDPSDPADLLPVSMRATAEGRAAVIFNRPANTDLQVEISEDLVNWELWDVPANAFTIPAGETEASVSGNLDESMERAFFRLRATQR